MGIGTAEYGNCSSCHGVGGEGGAGRQLSEGEVDDCTVECWLHGSRFDLRTGKPTGLPATERWRTVTATGATATDSAGKFRINWVAERHMPPTYQWRREDYNRTARLEEFLP